MAKGWTTIAIGAVSAVAIVLGLLVAGGPGHARKQKRDAQREQDLVAMASWVDCLARQSGSLPAVLAPAEQCPWTERLADPYSQEPYRYSVTGPHSYSLCANFELPPQRPADRWRRNAEGCISREFELRQDRNP
ncbi:MAG TPA: hypothetical protein VNQ78_12915 [Paracoccus sp. (in: a-proteobacteria)]|uniref:hypothetical protein n=1 Tax=Paracoccus sp. TaxID=267 RepID=UPI002CB533B9|nr:hypothetical protein [Paracoccus sp. (in: a-proteobacteria)]HWL57555.1 hypothetical protein [Paracoccus sp. (in: a-proteobacteria)]